MDKLILDKYPVINHDWKRVNKDSNEPTLSQLIHWDYNRKLLDDEIKYIPFNVVEEVRGLERCDNYFVRKVMKRTMFGKFDVYKTLEKYNSDPWGRKFLVYFGNVKHDALDSITRYYDFQRKNHISVFTNEEVNNFSGLMRSHVLVPSHILYVTTVSGSDVYCLDVVG